MKFGKKLETRKGKNGKTRNSEHDALGPALLSGETVGRLPCPAAALRAKLFTNCTLCVHARAALLHGRVKLILALGGDAPSRVLGYQIVRLSAGYWGFVATDQVWPHSAASPSPYLGSYRLSRQNQRFF